MSSGDNDELVEAWTSLHNKLWSFPPSLPPKNPAIDREIKAFRYNFARVRNLFSMADGSFVIGRIFEKFVVTCFIETLGHPYPTADDNPDLIKASIDRARRWHAGQEYARVRADFAEMTERPGRFLESPYFASGEASGFDGLIYSVLTGAWTAFEVLTADLWVAALNARPELGLVTLNALMTDADSDDAIEQKSGKKVELPVYLLKEWKFDLNGRMGTLLASTGQWDFANRKSVKSAYIKAFPSERVAIQAILDDQNLKWLAAARNAIVHNAGRADTKFVRITRSHSTLGKLQDGEPIPTSPALAEELATAAAAKGWELIACVDRWIKEV